MNKLANVFVFFCILFLSLHSYFIYSIGWIIIIMDGWIFELTFDE